MKKRTLFQAIAGLGFALSLSLVPLPAVATDHHHDHDAYSIELQFNDGQKWETDAPLRQAMGDIGLAVNAALDDIHHNTLDAAGYTALAGEINKQVAYMVENCELEPAADAQLHIVIARMLTSAQVMEQEDALYAKKEAVVKLVGALNTYAEYFEDEDFVKPVR